MKISFSGIYDIRFPHGTKDETIEKKARQANEYIIKKGYVKPDVFEPIVVKAGNFFEKTTNDKLSDKGIRIISTTDSPSLLYDIFKHIDNSLGQQYIDKTKVELTLDTKA